METVVTSIWQKSKVIIKALVIGIMALLLLIPTFFVQDLIKERENRQKEAVLEVSSKWATRQIITGPIIVLPYWEKTADANGHVTNNKHFAHFLPEQLTISSTVTPKEKYRGIYKVMLYTSQIKLSGYYDSLSLEKVFVPAQDVIWNEAVMRLYVSDNKGLNDEVKLNVNGTNLSFTPQNFEDESSKPGLAAPLNLTSVADIKRINFSGELSLNGSEQLLFTPVGKVSTVNMNSSWPDPSFTGNILPQNSSINKTGFTASWKSVAHTRSFPQQWTDNAFTVGDYSFNPKPDEDYVRNYGNSDNGSKMISSSSFGTNLFIPVNSYQKTFRSVKYAILCILLTFVAFFLIETNNKKSVHPLQYALIGCALVLFYTLLLSFSEYIGFNAAYAVAAFATIGLITWFVKSLLESSRLSVLLSVALVLLYSYVFTILQLQDYSLLIGSIGLFITLGIVMYFSRKVRW
jgi:inner membrane protein